MTGFSPKIEIITHFDNLINRVDIDIDECLKKYNDEQVINQLLSSQTNGFREYIEFYVRLHKNTDLSKHTEDHVWPESTKITDYLNQVRMRTIQELRKAQEDALEFYKLNIPRFKSDQSNNKKNIDELRSELFAEKFYFQVYLKQSEKRLWAFNLFTFVTDFYMSSSHIDSLE